MHRWDKKVYYENAEESKEAAVAPLFSETDYLILAQRYKELFNRAESGIGDGDIPYDIVGYITEIDTGLIDVEYMNSRFEKYIKLVNSSDISEEELEDTLNDLHRTFATLMQEEQKYANMFLHDVQRGDAKLSEGKTFRDYITEYQHKANEDEIHRCAYNFGLDEDKLRDMMSLRLNENNINEFGRLDALKNTVKAEKAKAFFEEEKQTVLNLFDVNILTDEWLRNFIIGKNEDNIL